MIPISDINPAKNIPIISRIFIIVTALIFIFITPKDDAELFTFFYEYAAIPCEIFNNNPLSMSQFYSNNCLTDPDVLIFANKNITFSLFVSLFLHANFLHVLGNLWSFWIFGNNIEDKLGKLRFCIFLFITGAASLLSHVLLNAYNINPIVGSSGIVSALMGAYLYLFPNARLLVLVPFGVLFPTTIKAKYFMLFWIISQLFIALQSNNISWEAHIGGFIFGYLFVKVFKYKRYTF